jgi:hypothetical protein
MNLNFCVSLTEKEKLPLNESIDVSLVAKQKVFGELSHRDKNHFESNLMLIYLC